MLEVHAEAVARGFVFLEPISEGDAESFKLRFYRMRRRSDKSMAAFIPPEYHLVMVGQWESGEDGNGRLPIIYNKRSDGVDLPGIVSATPDEAATYAPAPVHADPSPLDALDIKIEGPELDDFVAALRRKAADRK